MPRNTVAARPLPSFAVKQADGLKCLNHHGETGDMADFSPDHAIMVDSALSQQVEILRGPVTLLYSSGNVARFGRCCRWQNSRKNA